MDKFTRFTPEERDDLVAYLDGELEENAAQSIETKLAKSEVARREVDILSRTWDLLDVLPKPQASGEFTQKTITLAQVAEKPLVTGEERWIQWLKRSAILTGWAAALVLACVIGFQASQRSFPDESRMLVEELPLIENLDLYREAGSIEFLEELRDGRLFLEAPHAQAQ